MKNIMISSILAVTACLTMISQANAAPDVDKHSTAQVQHQKASVKFDHKHKQVKNKQLENKQLENKQLENKQLENKQLENKQLEKKAVASQHQSKRPPTAQQVKSKYQNKNIHKKHA